MKFLTIFVFAFVVLVSVSAAPAPDPAIKDWIAKTKNYIQKNKIADKLQEYVRKVLHSPAVKMGEAQLLKCVPDTAQKAQDVEDCLYKVAQEAARGLGKTINKHVFYKDFSNRYVGKV